MLFFYVNDHGLSKIMPFKVSIIRNEAMEM